MGLGVVGRAGARSRGMFVCLDIFILIVCIVHEALESDHVVPKQRVDVSERLSNGSHADEVSLLIKRVKASARAFLYFLPFFLSFTFVLFYPVLSSVEQSSLSPSFLLVTLLLSSRLPIVLCPAGQPHFSPYLFTFFLSLSPFQTHTFRATLPASRP